ncbi:MAG: hypothetical protein QM747_14750 [Nocardioides sp.]
MRHHLRRFALGLAAAAALTTTATTAAHAAELHDIGTHDSPDYALVFDQQETQQLVAMPDSSQKGGLECLGAQGRRLDAWRYMLDPFACGAQVAVCADSLRYVDRTDRLLAVDWHPGPGGGTYSCLTWRTGDAAAALIYRAVQIGSSA